MPETREPRSVVDAAERAAAAGDYASAEHLLREAALLQEASLGPLHPDLANTLNNLGVVCEIMDKPSDAERCFRRACAIATAALEPNHPFVATSRKNLEDFCAARGKAPDRPPYEEPRPAASRRWIHPSVLGAVVAALLVLALIATVTLFRSNDDVGSSPRGPGASPETPATRAKSPPAVPIGPHAPPNPPASSRPTASAPPPVVAAAQLCKDLSTALLASSGDWRCVAAGFPVGPGPLFYYTRLRSSTDTTVQHRWYRGDRLHQVVELHIRANTTGGYRTYSRTTVDHQDAGDWKVELRSRDKILLHEERFVVR
jgi:Tetratricopeptide repeat/Protein of unknown function (DUF2914)